MQIIQQTFQDISHPNFIQKLEQNFIHRRNSSTNFQKLSTVIHPNYPKDLPKNFPKLVHRYSSTNFSSRIHPNHPKTIPKLLHRNSSRRESIQTIHKLPETFHRVHPDLCFNERPIQQRSGSSCVWWCFGFCFVAIAADKKEEEDRHGQEGRKRKKRKEEEEEEEEEEKQERRLDSRFLKRS